MTAITQIDIPIKRNKIQRWLLIASAVFFVISLTAFFISDKSKSEPEIVLYKDLPLTDLLQQANSNYENGDFEKSIPYLLEAANRGNARAQYSLGYMYQKGEGVQKDIDKAKEYYQLSAKQGHVKAKSALKKLGN
ncbi:Sel1 repeat protein [compost metagenome]